MTGVDGEASNELEKEPTFCPLSTCSLIHLFLQPFIHLPTHSFTTTDGALALQIRLQAGPSHCDSPSGETQAKEAYSLAPSALLEGGLWIMGVNSAYIGGTEEGIDERRMLSGGRNTE